MVAVSGFPQATTFLVRRRTAADTSESGWLAYALAYALPEWIALALAARELPAMRNLDTIDPGLRLLAGVRWSIRDHGGGPQVATSTNCSTSATR